eukprot:372202-Pleurochrysis_carterae.AAC.1
MTKTSENKFEVGSGASLQLHLVPHFNHALVPHFSHLEMRNCHHFARNGVVWRGWRASPAALRLQVLSMPPVTSNTAKGTSHAAFAAFAASRVA